MSGKNVALGCLVVGVVLFAVLVFIAFITGPSDGQRTATQRRERPARVETRKADEPKQTQTQKAADAEKAIRKAFAGNPDVTSVRVHEMLLFMEISETLYRAMLMDRVGGNRFARQTARNFQGLLGAQVVSVYFEVGGETVITAQYSSWSGEIDVEYRDF